MVAEPTRFRWALYEGHRVAYRVVGDGPVVVVMKAYPALVDVLAAHGFRVVEIQPLGFGRNSDRPVEYPSGGIHEQVLAVLDEEGIDRFVVWGFSQGGSMAMGVAQGLPDRVDALVAGACLLIDEPSDAWLARSERQGRVPVGPMTFWRWFRRFDWLAELGAMPFPRLYYVGTEDTTRHRAMRRHRDALVERGVEIMEFEGLDHRMAEEQLERVVPDVLDWLAEQRVR